MSRRVVNSELRRPGEHEQEVELTVMAGWGPTGFTLSPDDSGSCHSVGAGRNTGFLHQKAFVTPRLPRRFGGYVTNKTLTTEVPVGHHIGGRQLQVVVKKRVVFSRAADLDNLCAR